MTSILYRHITACSEPPEILGATQGVPYYYSEPRIHIVWTNIYFNEATLLASCHGRRRAWNFMIGKQTDGKVLMGYQVILRSISGQFVIHIPCDLRQNEEFVICDNIKIGFRDIVIKIMFWNITYPLWTNRSYLEPSDLDSPERSPHTWVGPKSIRRRPGSGLAPRNSSGRHSAPFHWHQPLPGRSKQCIFSTAHLVTCWEKCFLEPLHDVGIFFFKLYRC